MSDHLNFIEIVTNLSGTAQGPLSHSVARTYLRHTHPMLGLDRVLDHDFNAGWVHALRAISCSQPAFEGHFPDAAIYPGTNLAQDIVQVAILLFIGSTGPLVQEERHQEISVVSTLTIDLGHPVPPASLLDVAVWRTNEQNPKTIDVQFEAQVRDFPFYTKPNKHGITFKPALRGSATLHRVKRRIYDGIGF